jgi:hypothetical protein
MEALVYGFDARAPVRLADPDWTDPRRAQYLLRPDISRPLSVDPRVWRGALPSGVTDGFAPDYWADLGALRHACEAHGLDATTATLVALAVRDGRDEARALFIPCSPSTLDPAWPLLGWDVADTGLTSALSNCGYLPAEADTLRRVFGPQLNAHGLFDTPHAAEAFRADSDERVPEHSPFLVHGIFLIPW